MFLTLLDGYILSLESSESLVWKLEKSFLFLWDANKYVCWDGACVFPFHSAQLILHRSLDFLPPFFFIFGILFIFSHSRKFCQLVCLGSTYKFNTENEYEYAYFLCPCDRSPDWLDKSCEWRRPNRIWAWLFPLIVFVSCIRLSPSLCIFFIYEYLSRSLWARCRGKVTWNEVIASCSLLPSSRSSLSLSDFLIYNTNSPQSARQITSWTG